MRLQSRLRSSRTLPTLPLEALLRSGGRLRRAARRMKGGVSHLRERRRSGLRERAGGVGRAPRRRRRRSLSQRRRTTQTQSASRRSNRASQDASIRLSRSKVLSAAS